MRAGSALLGLIVALSAAPAHAATNSVTFSTPGGYAVDLPPEVTGAAAGQKKVTLEAQGGGGGDAFRLEGGDGGDGAKVMGELDATGISTLQLFVASVGQAGMWGPGSAFDAAGGGGGASAIGTSPLNSGTTCPLNPTGLLLVAGGGGGGGASATDASGTVWSGGNGGGAGANGAAGARASFAAAGGGAATTSTGGAGGSRSGSIGPHTNGSGGDSATPGRGGNGESDTGDVPGAAGDLCGGDAGNGSGAGGGGGGGYRIGGGGGGAIDGGGGGGGGGANFVDGTRVAGAATTTVPDNPYIKLSWTDNSAPSVTIGSPSASAIADGNDITIGGNGGDGRIGDPTSVTMKLSKDGGPQTSQSASVVAGHWFVSPVDLSDGVWLIEVSGVDGAGNPGADTHTIAVDSTPPATSVSGPAHGAQLQTTSPTITGTGGLATTPTADSATMVIKVWEGTTTDGAPDRTETASRNGFTGGFSKTLTGLGEGTFTFTVSQSDGVNTATTSPRTFTTDVTAPDVGLTFPPATGGATKDSTPSITGTGGTLASDGDVTVEVWQGELTEPELASAKPLATLTVDPAAGGNWAVEAPALSPDGPYTVKAFQTDLAGNADEAGPRTFTLDTAAPAVMLSGPAGPINDSEPDFTGEAGMLPGDAQTLAVEIYPGTSIEEAKPTVVEVEREPNGDFAATAPPLEDGPYVARAVQLDSAGNEGVSAPLLSFVVDTVQPDPVLTSPEEGTHTNVPSPEFAGVAGLGTGDETHVVVEIRSGPGGDPLLALQAESNDATGEFTVSPAVNLSDGTYNVRVVQRDHAGNVGATSAREFTVDTDPPDVTLQEFPSGGLTSDSTPTFTGTAETGRPVTLEIFEGVGTGGTMVRQIPGPVTPPAADAPDQAHGTYSVNVSSALPDGQYTAVVSQRDHATNLGASPHFTFRVDATAPVIAVTSPAGGSVISDTTPAIAGNAEPGAVTVVISTLTEDVRTINTTAGSDGKFTADVSPALPDGDYSARARQTDAAGNTGVSAAVAFRVDTTPPNVIATGPTSPPAAPQIRVGKLQTDRRGRFTIRLDCARTSPAPCAGTLRIKRGRKAIVARAVSFDLAAGKGGVRRGRFARAFTKSLARKRRVSVAVEVVFVDASGRRSTQTIKATLSIRK